MNKINYKILTLYIYHLFLIAMYIMYVNFTKKLTMFLIVILVHFKLNFLKNTTIIIEF